MLLKNKFPSNYSKIKTYYDKTRWDYRMFWFRSKQNRALHFGYFDSGVQRHRDSLANLNQILTDKVGINSSDYVLDAGCGQGGSALWLAAHYACRVEGVTIVPHQVIIAEKDAFRKGLTDHVNFSLQDYCNTSFPDHHFSVVWALESLCHTEKKIDFYKEAYRVLKPGGRLIVADGVRSKRPFRQVDEALLQEWLQGWCCPDLDTSEEHHSNLLRAGFTSVRMEDVSRFVQPSMHKLYKKSKRLLPWAAPIRALGIQPEVNYNNIKSAKKQYEAYQQNLWFYAITYAIKA